MARGSVLWSIPSLWPEAEGARPCLLLARAEEWCVTVDDAVPLMQVGAPAEAFPGGGDCRWLRLGPLNCQAHEARWVQLAAAGETDAISLSSASLWNLFRIAARHGQCLSLAVHFAPLPDYLKSAASRPLRSPPSPSATLQLIVAADPTQDLFLPTGQLPEWLCELLRRAFRPCLGEEGCVLREGDCVWIAPEFPRTLLLLQVGSLPAEAFFSPRNSPKLSFHVEVASSNCGGPPRPSVPLEGGAKGIDPLPRSCRELVTRIRAVLGALRPTGSVTTFNLVGPASTAMAILRRIGWESGIALSPFPLASPLTVTARTSTSTSAIIWYLITRQRHQPHILAALGQVYKGGRDSSVPPLLFILTEAPLDGPESAMIYETFVIERLGLEDQLELLGAGAVLPEGELSLGGSREELLAAMTVAQVKGGDWSLGQSCKYVRRQLRKRRPEAEIPQVRWEDIAGLEGAKQVVRQFIQAPRRPDEGDRLGRRCGLLMWGPPGTGKTLMAKAVATEFSLSFISVKGPEVLDIYVGESEAHLRRIFAEARASQPCVLFFDELDSLAVARGRDGDAAGVTDRLVAQLLLEMDELLWNPECAQVFLLGATNRPDLLDPALLRTGRFDRLIHLGLPETAAEQVQIMKTATQGLDLEEDVDFEGLAVVLPKSLSPADLASICRTARRLATARIIRAFESNLDSSPKEVKVTQGDLIKAASVTRPSTASASHTWRDQQQPSPSPSSS